MGQIQTSWRWRRLRRAILAREPLCRTCLAGGDTREAEELDHIKPLAKRPDLAWAPSNLQPLCRPCHSAKTAHESGGPQRMGATLEGDLKPCR